MIEIDGSFGESGGQIIRTAFALSALLRKPVTVSNIRAGRPKPGLRAQHLTALQTLAQICNAEVSGAKMHSEKVSFIPKTLSEQHLSVNIGSAGSISLLLCQLLPVALIEKISLRVIGGTDVAFSPPINFLSYVLFPKLKEMNARFQLEVLQRGYFPKGNGRVFFQSFPSKLPLKPIQLTELGELQLIKCFSHCAGLPGEVALTQSAAAKKEIFSAIGEIDFEENISHSSGRTDTIGSGIDLFAVFSSGNILAGNFLGAKGLPAERVGVNAAKHLIQQIKLNAPCDFHLADQLIPFMALAKGESIIKITKLSQHTLTNIAITEKFLPVKFEVKGNLNEPAEVSVKGIAFK